MINLKEHNLLATVESILSVLIPLSDEDRLRALSAARAAVDLTVEFKGNKDEH